MIDVFCEFDLVYLASILGCVVRGSGLPRCNDPKGRVLCSVSYTLSASKMCCKYNVQLVNNCVVFSSILIL